MVVFLSKLNIFIFKFIIIILIKIILLSIFIIIIKFNFIRNHKSFKLSKMILMLNFLEPASHLQKVNFFNSSINLDNLQSMDFYN